MRFIRDPQEITPQPAQPDSQRLATQLIAERVGDGWIWLFDIAGDRRAIFWTSHLDGGGALSGGSRWSKAMVEPPINPFTNMRPSPVTRLAATK